MFELLLFCWSKVPTIKVRYIFSVLFNPGRLTFFTKISNLEDVQNLPPFSAYILYSFVKLFEPNSFYWFCRDMIDFKYNFVIWMVSKSSRLLTKIQLSYKRLT